MAYKEDLPDDIQCPPAEAVEDAIPEAYRMVFSDPPTEEDFKSKAARGVECPPDHDPCGFASCSLFTTARQTERLAQLPLPRSKGARVAKVAIPAGSGKWLRNSKHIHFWAYAEFDLAAAVIEVKAAV